MFGKKKKNDIVENDDVIDEEDMEGSELPEDEEEKEEEPVKEDEKKHNQTDDNSEVLNSAPKTKVGKTFKMYQFVIKIAVVAILITFAILMFLYTSELIGAVYMVAGVIIAFSAIIRMIPLIKTSRTKRARLITFIQCLIHLVLGAYLILAAFFHWNALKEYAQKLSEHTATATDDIYEKLEQVSGGWFGKFNIEAFAYILVIFFFTMSVGYYWVTICYDEYSRKSLFWGQTICNTLAVVIAVFAKYLNANQLVISLAVLALICSVCIGGEAGGGYYRYRKSLAPGAKKEKTAKKEKGKEAPAQDDSIDYTDIDPNTIPKDDPRDGSNIVS